MGDVFMELLDLDNDKCDLGFKLPSPVRKQFTSDAIEEDIVSQLRSAFNEALQFESIEEESKIDPILGANGGSEDDKTPLNAPPSISIKCLCKSSTFPVMDQNSLTFDDIKDEAHVFDSDSQDNVSCLRSMSLPVPRKIIPAVKGSREKEGLPLRKLSVSWAPDVYDPPPSSVSHLPKKKNSQQYSRYNKRHGKGKNKSKNTRGSSSSSSKKEKKHHREDPSLGRKFTMDSVAGTEKKFIMDPVAGTEKKFTMDPVAGTEKKFTMDPVAGTEKIMSINYKSTVELLDFNNDVDSPDSNCGSSFLRKSRGTLHFPYAETT